MEIIFTVGTRCPYCGIGHLEKNHRREINFYNRTCVFVYSKCDRCGYKYLTSSSVTLKRRTNKEAA